MQQESTIHYKTSLDNLPVDMAVYRIKCSSLTGQLVKFHMEPLKNQTCEQCERLFRAAGHGPFGQVVSPHGVLKNER